MRKKWQDDGHEETEAVLRTIEKQITREYAQAEREIKEKLDDYLRRFEVKDEIKRKAVALGNITQADYEKWRTGQILVGQRWAEMRDSIAQDLTKTDQLARSTAFGHIPEVYAINHNYGTYQVEKASKIDTSYTLYDRQTVERLMLDEEGSFVPKPGRKLTAKINAGKAEAWNKKNVQSVMIQGILQGESIPNIATRLSNAVGEQNRKAAIRNARTMVTGVQNAGRVDSYERAKEMGINVGKQWLATLDLRTRHWHAELDGVIKETDQPFENEYGEIMYPGDPTADPANIYNCRCTLIAALKGFERDLSDLSDRRSEKLGNMTYEEWKEEHETYSDPITKQDDIADMMKRSYIQDYKYISGQNPNIQSDDFRLPFTKPKEEPEEPSFVFEEAKSKKEAEEYAKSWATSVDYDGISLEKANTINEQMGLLTSKYKINNLDSFGVGFTDGAAMASNSSKLAIDPKQIGKKLEEVHEEFVSRQIKDQEKKQSIIDRYARGNRKIPRDMQTIIDNIDRNAQYNRWSVADYSDEKLKVVVTHEYGHILSDQYFGLTSDVKASARANEAEFYSLRFRWKTIYEQARDDGDIFNLSQYGGKNEKEFFAECFAAREFGEELPDYVESFMKEVLNRAPM